ncbi:transcription factor RelB isoform X2 [Carettochelys insculpta]|uniref:transcription factor RelB isoform X2 n=1 Tax=Carettochelys insculpta TaxID=44489 RepID=UPI003EC08AFD
MVPCGLGLSEEIIEELIMEDGFQPEAPPFLPKVSPKGTAKLVPRGSNPARPLGMLRLAEPTGPGPLQGGSASFGSSLPAATPLPPLDSRPPLLSQSLSSLQLTPRLVSRGTAPAPASQPHWAAPICSPKEQLEDMLEPPRLVITEQPKQRGMRFRYECEGRSAGSILGESSTEASKTLPAIELLNCQKIPEVKVVACLVWKDWPHRIHPHSLVGKDCSNGLCEVTLRPQVNPKHSFNNLGIQCVKKKEIEAAIEKKLQLGIDPFKAGSLKNHQEVDMNVVRICFQASYQEPSGQTRHLSPVLSEPIFDKKSTNTSELRICRMNKEWGPCTGGEELYLLCDKVQKEDIAVVFRRDAWESKADFSQADVHRQIAIVFKTPPYQNLDILEPVEVEVYLQRLTDSVCSEPFHFTYLPKDPDTYGVHIKRKRGMPDVLEELSASDPHGIEAKKRKKKPDYMDHFLTPQATEEGFALPASLEHITVPDPLDFYLGQDYGAYGGVNQRDVMPAACPSMELPSCLDPEFLLGTYSPAQSSPAPYLVPGDSAAGDTEGTASLVGSNMFPSQYKEAYERVEQGTRLGDV